MLANEEKEEERKGESGMFCCDEVMIAVSLEWETVHVMPPIYRDDEGGSSYFQLSILKALRENVDWFDEDYTYLFIYFLLDETMKWTWFESGVSRVHAFWFFYVVGSTLLCVVAPKSMPMLTIQRLQKHLCYVLMEIFFMGKRNSINRKNKKRIFNLYTTILGWLVKKIEFLRDMLD